MKISLIPGCGWVGLCIWYGHSERN